MERGTSMKRNWRRILPFVLTLTVVSHSLLAQETTNHLVLVTAKATGIRSLTTSEIRRLFMGLPVSKNGRKLEALVNQSDPLLYQVFLQKVVFMSAQVYERHLLENVVQLGGQRPKIHNQQEALVADLHRHPGKVSYIWNYKLRIYPSLVAVGEIWRPLEE